MDLAPATSAACAGTQPWDDASLPPGMRAALVVAVMSQDEKFAWLSGPIGLPAYGASKPAGAIGSAAYYPGVPRLGIPPMQQTDAGLGVTNPGTIRPHDDATALPASLLLGATFDPGLAWETGALLGREARAKGFSVVLGGGANLIREPRGGRIFEYVSEDPLLTGVIAGNSIAGIQSEGVVSTIKHFLLNAQETGRVVVSSDLGAAAMHESDLLAFQIGIEIGCPGSVMTAYNRVNGTYASESAFLIGTVLKGAWGYPGWVMSDWGGTHSTEAAALAGLDVQSGANIDREPFFGQPLRAAVDAGRVPQSRIDDMVGRILGSLFAAGVIDRPPQPGGTIDFGAHHAIAQRAAEQGIVLLKNEHGLLPAAYADRIVVIGGNADRGVLAGGGSSQVTPLGSVAEPGVTLYGQNLPRTYHPSPPLAAIKAERMAAQLDYLDGMDVAAAARIARGADLVVLFATEWRSEGHDAHGLALPYRQDALIEAVAAANPRMVVVLETGGPVAMPWLARVPAVLQAFYLGSGGGPAIAGVLSGRVNPSGRLPCTFPANQQQLPHPVQRDPATTTPVPEEARNHPMFHVPYDLEGADVGYRWFERQGLTPLYPFGHGLSYTRFAVSDVVVAVRDAWLAVSLTIANVGERAGADVPQVYVGMAGPDGFVSRLGGFCKVCLEPGEHRRVTIEVDPRLLARYDIEAGGFRVAAGQYRVDVGRFAGDAASVVQHIELAPAFV